MSSGSFFNTMKTKTNGSDSILDPGHDHEFCVESAVSLARSLCQEKGIRLTPLRERVLELVWSSHRPIGAYEILDVLRSERGGAAPPTAYRALDFLMENGLIHRVESLNAFVGCADAGHRHGGQFLICQNCGKALELQDKSLDIAIAEVARKAGFSIDSRTIELIGTCPFCRDGNQQTGNEDTKGRGRG
jgi:Fur family transcriptional regulator, zinc uptake regulator